jgi:hypothetical protein
MTTLRQVEANRKNAQKSTGPRTQDGKERSRANRYTHGLAGDGIVLTDDEAEIVAGRLVAWGAEYDPRNQDERWLFEQMVLESVRIERCQDFEQGLLYRQIVSAEESWDDDRTLEAVQLGTRLARKPELVAFELQMTAQGCTLLIARWTGLLDALKHSQPWDDSLRSLAMDLLGIVPALRDAFTRLDPAAASAPDHDVVEHQSALARGEIDRLSRKKLDQLDHRDAYERELCAGGYALPTREMHLLRRYEAACHRRLERAMHKLASVRRAPTAAAPAARPNSFLEMFGRLQSQPDPNNSPEPIDIDDDDLDEFSDPRAFALVEDAPPPVEEAPVMSAPAPEVASKAGALPTMSPDRYHWSFDAPDGLISSVLAVSADTSARNGSTSRPHGNRKQRRAEQMKARRVLG